MADNNAYKFQISPEKRADIAREAFYGGNEELADKIKQILGYEMDNQFYPANGFDLAEAIKVVSDMEAAELLASIENSTLALVQHDTELISGDERSIKVIYNNITGRNFLGEEHTNYLAWVINELKFPQLAPAQIFLTVK